jgi:hypothetical integral membrane protein (TIGR02206 family)
MLSSAEAEPRSKALQTSVVDQLDRLKSRKPGIGRNRDCTMQPNIQLFGLAHLVILLTVVALAAALVAIQRVLPAGSKILRRFVGFVLLADATVYNGYLLAKAAPAFPSHLPLELCDASACLVILSLLFSNRTIFDIAYYGALAGASMALITPNLWEPFPSYGTVQFFIVHGLIVSGVLYLVLSGLAQPTRHSVWIAMLGVNIYAACVGAFDAFFKTNYMYLRAKPAQASLLDLLGPWPWYIASGEVIALISFQLLYLPFRFRRAAADELPRG